MIDMDLDQQTKEEHKYTAQEKQYIGILAALISISNPYKLDIESIDSAVNLYEKVKQLK